MSITSEYTVLYITDSLNIGGAERQLLLLANNLPENWTPIIVSLCKGPLFEVARKSGIHTILVERKNKFDALGPILAIKEIARRIHPDIIHSWGWMSTMLATIVQYSLSIPLVSGVVRLGGIPNQKRRRIKFASRLGNITIGNSRAGLGAWNVPEQRGRVVHNGFDWTRLPHSFNKVTTISDSFKVIMIANMAPRKDWEAFIRVAELSHLLHKNRKISFIGYGTGPLRNQLLDQSNNILETGTLQLPGKTDNPIKVCMEADIGVLFSTFGEGISNTIMEYMACELPVICSNSGGNPELIEDRITGFLVDRCNPTEQILERILWLQDHKLESENMGIAGKYRLENYFSVEKLVKRTINVYKELL